MNTDQITNSLTSLFGELVNGPPKTGAYMLNRGDIGMLNSLDLISATTASTVHGEGTSVAAHVEHLRYGLSLLNRWAAGENPFDDADWSASWEKTSVTDQEWEVLIRALRDEVQRWSVVLGTPREVDDVELNGLISSIAHLAYHLGAIRQMDPTLRGPRAND